MVDLRPPQRFLALFWRAKMVRFEAFFDVCGDGAGAGPRWVSGIFFWRTLADSGHLLLDLVCRCDDRGKKWLVCQNRRLKQTSAKPTAFAFRRRRRWRWANGVGMPVSQSREAGAHSVQAWARSKRGTSGGGRAKKVQKIAKKHCKCRKPVKLDRICSCPIVISRQNTPKIVPYS